MGEGSELNTIYMWVTTLLILCFSVFGSLFLRNNRDFHKLYNLYSRKHIYDDSDVTTEGKKHVFLNKTKVPLKLINVIDISKTAKLYIFSYPSKYDNFGLSICKHLKFFGANVKGVVEGQWNGMDDAEASSAEIARSYTPIYVDTKKREVHFVIRIYYADGNYIDGGKMSQYLSRMKVNEEIKIFGPLGLLEYGGSGSFTYLSKKIANMKHIVMIAGGTGMTPFFRLINSLLFPKNSKADTDSIYVTFIYANRNEEEILLKPIFDEFNKKFVNFKIVYSIDKCLKARNPSSFDNVGFINLPLLKKYILKYEKLNLQIPSANTIILICGPPRMAEHVQKLLKDFITEEQIITL